MPSAGESRDTEALAHSPDPIRLRDICEAQRPLRNDGPGHYGRSRGPWESADVRPQSTRMNADGFDRPADEGNDRERAMVRWVRSKGTYCWPWHATS